MSNDSVSKTITVAVILCVVCSLLVAGSAVMLKPKQVENKKLDVKKNLLLACGLLTNTKAKKSEILEKFKAIEIKIIDLETGLVNTDIDADNFDQRKAASDIRYKYDIPRKKDIAGIMKRSKFSKVYFVKENQQTKMIILPVHGKGLWSTMYGFLALDPKLETVKGIGFYEHGETPGLGGEIDNPSWKKIWIGKKVFSESLKPLIRVVKGAANPRSKSIEYEIDGLSGATITSAGVSNLVKYWLGENGFGAFFKNYRAGGIQ